MTMFHLDAFITHNITFQLLQLFRDFNYDAVFENLQNNQLFPLIKDF